MKKKLLKGIIIISLLMASVMPVYAGTNNYGPGGTPYTGPKGVRVNTGAPIPGSRDNERILYETELKKGNITEETFYQTVITGAFSPSVVAQILKDGYLTQYAESFKAAGLLPSDYVVKGSTQTTTTAVTTTDFQTYSAIFDASYYLKAYPELSQSVGTDSTALLNHFVNIGMNECRQGNADFNVYTYAQNNPDLFTAYGMNAKQYYIHYITSGKSEGRIAK